MTRCMGCMSEYDGSTGVCPHCGYVRGTAAREAYHLAPESILQGRYIVGRVLGFGGFGVTYIGWDAQLERVVAIKEFLPTTFATRMPGGTAVTVYEGGATTQFGFGLERFVQEAQRLAQFNGIRGITDIYDTFSGNNTAYIVMEFLRGRDVKQALAADGPMPYEKARDIVLRVCDTLAPVHAKGIIHRDISPDNIYLTDDGEVKLLDFGAARYESSVNSKSLSVILKSGYAPEEQYRSKGDQGPWTDVYALAATFYKMLTGITPPDSMERAVRDEIKEPSKLDVKMPQSAENALMNALNLRKGDRIQSAQAFKEALQSGQAVEWVKVKPRRAQTGKIPVPAIVAMALVGVLVVVYLSLGAAGVVALPGDAPLPDTFGAAVAGGMAVVPDLMGKTEAEARQLLEEAGLVMEPTEGGVSATIAAGTIVSQEPVAGRQVAEGGTVQAAVCLGTFWQAYEDGLLPQFENLTAPQAVAAFAEMEVNYRSPYWPQYAFEHSDAVAEGSVIRYDTHASSETYIAVVVSAGPQGEYHLRAPFLSGGFDLEYATTTNENWPETWLQASADSAQWHDLMQIPKGSLSDEDAANGYAPSNDINFERSLVSKFPELIGQTLQLRLSWQEGGETHTVPFPQQLALEELPDEGTRVDSIQFVTWEEIEELNRQGVLRQNNEAVQHMRNMTDRDEEGQPYNLYNHPPVVVRGVFEHDSYSIIKKDHDGYNGGRLYNYDDSADENGVYTGAFILSNRDIGSDAYYGENYDTDVVMYTMEYTDGYTRYSADGSTLTMRITKPHTCTVTASPALEALLVASPDYAPEPESAYDSAYMEE